MFSAETETGAWFGGSGAQRGGGALLWGPPRGRGGPVGEEDTRQLVKFGSAVLKSTQILKKTEQPFCITNFVTKNTRPNYSPSLKLQNGPAETYLGGSRRIRAYPVVPGRIWAEPLLPPPKSPKNLRADPDGFALFRAEPSSEGVWAGETSTGDLRSGTF